MDEKHKCISSVVDRVSQIVEKRVRPDPSHVDEVVVEFCSSVVKGLRQIETQQHHLDPDNTLTSRPIASKVSQMCQKPVPVLIDPLTGERYADVKLMLQILRQNEHLIVHNTQLNNG